VHPTPGKVRRGWRGGSLRVFKQFSGSSQFRQSGVVSSRPLAGTPQRTCGAGRKPLGIRLYSYAGYLVKIYFVTLIDKLKGSNMSTLLENGIAAAKNGDKTRARQYIQQALQENPKNIVAWLWMSTLVNEVEHKKICYERVLALDPKNEHALKGIAQLGITYIAPAPTGTNEIQSIPVRQPSVPEPQRKKFEYIETIDAQYKPSWDIYEPHMPSVDLHTDMEEFFENARLLGLKGSEKGFREKFERMHPEYEGRVAWLEKIKEGERFVPVISPGRIIFLLFAFQPNTRNAEAQNVADILPSKKNLKITAISYTYMPDFMNGSLSMEDRLVGVVKCIPFMGQMASFTGVKGHSVLIFEGHPSVFEAGVKNSDVLFIDSGMLKFLQEDWAEVAFRCMNSHCKIFIHERQGFKLRSVIQKKDYPGWDYGIGIGNEENYVKMLDTVLASGELRGKHILLTVGRPLPNLSQLTKKPDELEFLSKIPFDYEQLDIPKIIKLILDRSEKKFLSSKRTYNIKYHQTGTNKIIDYTFSIKTAEDKSGNTMIDLSLD